MMQESGAVHVCGEMARGGGGGGGGGRDTKGIFHCIMRDSCRASAASHFSKHAASCCPVKSTGEASP